MSSLIVVEGIDGMGKSSLAEEVAKKIGGVYYKTPAKPYIQKKDIVNRQEAYLRFPYYLEAMLYSFTEIRDMIRQGKNVVADRWMWSTLVYHFVLDDSLMGRWNTIKESINILYPDISFLITISDYEIWKERLTKDRVLTVQDQQLLNSKPLSEKMQKLYLQLNPNFVVIDNYKEFSQSLNEIYSVIAERILKKRGVYE